MYGYCQACGKELSDPVSMQIGLGPVCRMKEKINDSSQMDIFGSADFTYKITEGVLCIIDLNKGRKSVTNDIENVLAIIKQEQPEWRLDSLPVIYRDSRGIWDGIKTVRGHFVDFYPIAKIKLDDALAKARQPEQAVAA